MIPIESFSKTEIPNMVAECRGNQKEIQEKAIKYLEKNWKQIQIATFKAEIGLLKLNHGTAIRFVNDKTYKELGKVISTAKKLHAKVSVIYSDTAPIEMSGLAEALYEYFYIVSNWEKEQEEITKFGIGEAGRRERDWEDFVASLGHHIDVFEHIKKKILDKKKQGRPKQLQGLVEYVREMALLYSACTGKKFTVCEYGDTDCFTEGMRFIEKSLTTIDQNSRLKEKFYTTENFENACAYVVKKAT